MVEKEFAQFYREHYSLVLSTVNRRVLNTSDSEDLTAEVFRIAWQRHTTGADLTLPWLFQVVHNLVGNEYRRRQRSRNLIEKATAFATEPEATTGTDDGVQVRVALGQLRERDSEILYLAYWDDLSTDEIAQILSISTSAVRVRLLRARRALKTQLQSSAVLEGSENGRV